MWKEMIKRTGKIELTATSNQPPAKFYTLRSIIDILASDRYGKDLYTHHGNTFTCVNKPIVSGGS